MVVNDVFSIGADIAINDFSSLPLDQFFDSDILNALSQINDSLIVIIVLVGAIFGAHIIRSLRK